MSDYDEIHKAVVEMRSTATGVSIQAVTRVVDKVLTRKGRKVTIPEVQEALEKFALASEALRPLVPILSTTSENEWNRVLGPLGRKPMIHHPINVLRILMSTYGSNFNVSSAQKALDTCAMHARILKRKF